MGASALAPLQADPGAPASPKAAHGACSAGVPVVRGRLVPAESGSGCRYAIQDAAGKRVPLIDDPQVDAVARQSGVKTVELVGETVPFQGSSALKVSSLRVSEDGGGKHFPLRGRCVHCGCRMQIDSAREAQERCDLCNCGKPNSECFK